MHRIAPVPYWLISSTCNSCGNFSCKSRSSKAAILTKYNNDFFRRANPLGVYIYVIKFKHFRLGHSAGQPVIKLGPDLAHCLYNSCSLPAWFPALLANCMSRLIVASSATRNSYEIINVLVLLCVPSRTGHLSFIRVELVAVAEVEAP